ncbi:MAG: dipeptidyl aminopeptidase/acylaminoacyl peptidase [Chitinophagaceae bacterium]|nr:dipeptidyl aminopeptidase/acylaminoacyl peptidase [Chitinophagaceae bacterium]
MYKFAFTILWVLFFSITNAQVKKPVTHETMWMMKRVGAPEVSPDGKWVVFSVTEPSYTEKDIVSDLWIVPADGSSKPRKLTFGKASESGYKWSPDSKYIAFAAKREEDEVPQIYIMNISEGGEAQRFSNISTGAGSPQWSPDGKMILFTNKVFPGNFTDSANKKTAEERKKIKYNARVYTSFPIRNWDQWIDDKQTHAFVQSIESGSTAKDIFANVSATVKDGFAFNGFICWAPDNKAVVFSAATDFTSAAFLDPTSQLYKLSINGGDAVPLTNDGDDYGSPAFSPGGKYLFCQASANNNNKVYNLPKLTRYDWPSFSNKTQLTAKLDRPVNSYVVTADNKIVMSIEDQANDKILIMDAVKGDTKELTAMHGSYTAVSVSSDGKIIVSTYENASKPAEIVRISGDTKNISFLTSFNDAALAALDLQSPEIFWYTSSRGKKIKSMLVRPAGFDASKKYPLFVVMHGGPAGAWKDNWGYRWNYHLLASPGYVVLLTDYTGSTGYGEKFSQDIQFDPLKGPADEINEAADDAIKHFSFIDGSRQAAGGGSYGGHLANWMQATTTHYKCLIAHAGMVNSESQYATSDYMYGREVMNGGAPWMQTAAWKEQNPIRFAAKFKTPVLITVGERDFRVPLNNSIENFGVLQRLKVPSKLIVFPEENHWILKPEDSRFWYKEVQDWLKKYL